jgi:hypothetical protein
MSNPSVTFRVTPADRKRLADLMTRTGKSLGQILREGLGLAERDETAAFNRGVAHGQKLGFDRGLEEGEKRFAIHYYCSICGKYDPIVLPGSKDHQAVVDALHEKGWGHSECHRKKPQ